jgi:hypothetical protein
MKHLHLLSLMFLVLTGPGVFAQSAAPDAPPSKPESLYTQHRFFDLMNDSAMGGAAIPIIGDSLSTQRFLGTGLIGEANPVARPFVKTPGGQAFISSVGFGSMIGGMYLFHRLEGHAGEHKAARRFFSFLERTTPVAVSAVEFNRWHHNNVLIQQANRLCGAPNVSCR